MSTYTIWAINPKVLAQICVVLVKAGLCFEADAFTGKITLTGGY